jgi:hypothetical protein
MTTQAIESVPQQSMNNQSSLLVSAIDDNSFMINNRINLATTLALLVGLIQVSFVR